MKKSSFIVIMVFSVSLLIYSQETGREGTEQEISLSNQAFMDACSLYESMGFDLQGLNPPEVYFASPSVIDDQLLPNTIAVYNNVKKEVYMTPFQSESFQSRNILGTFGVEEVYYSILFHEFCHHLNNFINPSIAPHHDEFIAAALQLSVISARVVNRAVELFNGLVFESRSDITLLAYISTPKDFQVASFLYGKRNPLQLKNIISNSHNMVRDPFLVDRI